MTPLVGLPKTVARRKVAILSVMSRGFFGGASRTVVALADVGSASAGFALVKVRRGNPALVLAAHRNTLPPEERSAEAAVARLPELLEDAGKRVLEQYIKMFHKEGGPIARAYVVMRAPWVHSKAVHSSKEFPQDVRISGRVIADIAKEALHAADGIDKQNFLEATVTAVELNGYLTREPEGKMAHSVALTGWVSDSDPRMRASVGQALGRLLPHVPPAYYSATRVLLFALGDRIMSRDCVIVDVSSDASTITVVYNGVAQAQEIVGEGVRSIAQRLAPGGMPEETISLLHLLEREQCDTDVCQSLRDSIGRVEPELVRLFGEAMGKIAATRRLPSQLVLCTHSNMSAWLARFFSRIDFTQFTQTAQPFSVQEITASDFTAEAQAEHGIVLDVGLAAAATLVNKE